jgi:hypothetical protein
MHRAQFSFESLNGRDHLTDLDIEGLRTGRPGFDPRPEAEDFPCTPCVQTGCGAHPASCTVGTGGSFPGGKARPERDADHSPPPSSAEVKKQ